MPQNYFIYYVAAINIIALVMMGIDKSIAIKNGKKKNTCSKNSKESSRIPEATLIMLAVMLGSVGAFLGMQIFRHKTKHLKFTIGVPLCFVLNCIIVYFMYKLNMVI